MAYIDFTTIPSFTSNQKSFSLPYYVPEYKHLSGLYDSDMNQLAVISEYSSFSDYFTRNNDLNINSVAVTSLFYDVNKPDAYTVSFGTSGNFSTTGQLFADLYPSDDCSDTLKNFIKKLENTYQDIEFVPVENNDKITLIKGTIKKISSSESLTAVKKFYGTYVLQTKSI